MTTTAFSVYCLIAKWYICTNRMRFSHTQADDVIAVPTHTTLSLNVHKFRFDCDIIASVSWNFSGKSVNFSIKTSSYALFI